MKNNSLISIKIIHLILLIIALASNLYSIIIMGNDTSIYGTSNLIGYVKMSLIVAIVASLIYLIYGYKKSAAIYYKITMGLLTLAQALDVINIMNTTITPLSSCLLQVLALILMTIIATAKDMGEKNTTILVLLLVTLRIASLGIVIYHLPMMSTERVNILTTSLSNLLFAGTVGLMAMAKYEDKEARGSK